MTRSLKLAAGIVALLVATFGVIEVAGARQARPAAPVPVVSTPASEEAPSSGLPLEQD
jgi:hypothetical protein